jgi:pyridoxal/pyridoxine/pyridoxamine kinase
MIRRPHDALARKYCFRASVNIVNAAKAPVGVFFGYGTKPTIAKEVEEIGEQFCMDVEDARYACDPVELVIHEECPVELTNEIYFQPFEALSHRQE